MPLCTTVFLLMCHVYFITRVYNVPLITACRQQTDFRCALGEIACEGVE